MQANAIELHSLSASSQLHAAQALRVSRDSIPWIGFDGGAFAVLLSATLVPYSCPIPAFAGTQLRASLVGLSIASGFAWSVRSFTFLIRFLGQQKYRGGLQLGCVGGVWWSSAVDKACENYALISHQVV
ncbi:uncharacterized protein N7459_002167 [Penicillium hispanicum]|uniref:uncharacterized protein n=1 Tax=Penicillium hispanicum TaxID=1080232 RepID=UPI002540FDA0|nr:uncharacterized protein N7459_002167 [Penicillium hispanicum]KAJ5591798.1 hypothetical protein N7459_002167 [Penicillium hispanicum]